MHDRWRLLPTDAELWSSRRAAPVRILDPGRFPQCVEMDLATHRQHLGGLEPDCRYALTRVEVDGAAYADVGVELGIAVPIVKLLVHAGRVDLLRRGSCN